MTDASANYAGVWDNRLGFGERPAILSIDLVQAYTTPGAPLYAPGVVSALPHAARIIDEGRRRSLPVIHTTIRYSGPDCQDGGIWVLKSPVMKQMTAGNPLSEFCPEVLPADHELVIVKQYASAFFGTSLHATLTAAKIDTLIMVGCSTSGCIRASAVDAVQYGFRPIVVREGVGDRHPDPHEANLFDINSKYGDVLGIDEVLNHLAENHPALV